MSKIILKESYLYIIGEIISKGIPVLLLPYMAKKMGVNELAEYSIYQSIIAFSSICLLLSMDGAIARYYHRYGFRAIERLKNVASFISAVLCLIFILISYLFSYYYMAMACLVSFCYVIYMLNLSVAQASRQVDKYLAAQLISGFVLLISIILFFEFSEATSETRIYASALSWFLPSFWLVFNLKTYKHKIRKKINIKHALYLFSFGLPLLLHSFSGMLKGHVERFFINESFSKTALAEYFLAMQIASIFYLLLLALNRAIVPHFYSKMKSSSLNIKVIEKLVLKSFLIIPIFPFLVYLIPDQIFYFFFGNEYMNLNKWTSILVLGYALMIPYFIMVNVLFYKAKNKLISTISVIAAGVHVIISYFFSKISMDLLVYTLFISSLLQLIVMYFYTFNSKVKVIK
ncbi:oligosaccharide flippase family protein [Pseudoalteromonas lipolytica]|uniref:oligosaccharide flippase family protein n=1 Tax=Pseudoalteromonas lipolytica TaxID=570156 RepID=UPI003A97890F